MKKKKIISLVILIIGFGLITFGVYINYRSKISTKDLNNNNYLLEKNNYYTSITNYSNSKDINKELCISNLLLQDNENSVVLKFNLLNNTDKIIKDKNLQINLYNNDKLLDTLEYQIEELDIDDELGLQMNIETSEKLTKYVFEYDNFKTTIDSNLVK